jgi:hypothetical protein
MTEDCSGDEADERLLFSGCVGLGRDPPFVDSGGRGNNGAPSNCRWLELSTVVHGQGVLYTATASEAARCWCVCNATEPC